MVGKKIATIKLKKSWEGKEVNSGVKASG